VVAGTEGGIVMVESGAQQASEAEVLDAIEFGHDCCKKIAAAIRELVKKTGKTKKASTPRRRSTRRCTIRSKTPSAPS
jgi:polyribonucleotide nucleotidyltransferase